MSKNQLAPTDRQYSEEFNERAVRMVRQLREETAEKKGTIGWVAGQLGCGVEVAAQLGATGRDRSWRDWR